MSGNGKALLFLLQRSVRAAQINNGVRTVVTPALTGVRTTGTLPVRFIQQRTWASVGPRSLCGPRSAVHTPLLGLCTRTEAPVEDEYPPLPDYHSESESEPQRKEVYVIQVKGLPWSCTAQDLLQFFSECRVRNGLKGIHLTTDRLGRPSGQAFIEMGHEEDVTKALQKHRQYLGPRYVEVYEVTNSDAEAILKRAVQNPSADAVVRLRGLPYTSTEADITQFFSGLDIMDKGIIIVTDRRGRNSGEAFVQFCSQEVADEALSRDREMIGNRYIEVFPSGRDEILSSRRSSGPVSGSLQTSSVSSNPRPVSAMQTPRRQGSHHASEPQLHYVHMRGLPFTVSAEQIVQFFSPLVVSKILMEFGRDGKSKGEADIYFSCHQEAVAAMSKDRMHIGERYIELFLNSEPDSDRR